MKRGSLEPNASPVHVMTLGRRSTRSAACLRHAEGSLEGFRNQVGDGDEVDITADLDAAIT